MIRSPLNPLSATLAAALLLAGCVKEKTVVTVNPDGSGNIVVSTVMPPETVMMIEQLTKSMEAQLGARGGALTSATNRPDPFFDEKKLRKAARRYGPGVKYVKGQKVDKDGARGSVAVYSFPDIGDVFIATSSTMENMGPSMTGAGEEEDVASSEKPRNAVEFSFKTNGPNRTLTILMPELPKPDLPPPAAVTSVATGRAAAAKAEAVEPGRERAATAMAGPGVNPMAGMVPFGMTGNEKPEEAMMKMMKGMEISLAVQVKGRIVKTTAAHRDPRNDARVTLMDMNFDKLMSAPQFKQRMNPQAMDAMDGPEEAMAAFAGMPGATVETNRQVVVEFQ